MNPGNDKSKSISGVRGHHEPRKRFHHKPRKRIYYSHFQGLDIWDWIFPHSDFTNKFSFPTWECLMLLISFYFSGHNVMEVIVVAVGVAVQLNRPHPIPLPIATTIMTIFHLYPQIINITLTTLMMKFNNNRQCVDRILNYIKFSSNGMLKKLSKLR